MNFSEKPKTNLLFVNFNQDYSCLSVGTTDSFKVFNTQPKLTEVCSAQLGSGVGICEMLFTSSLVALVGAGNDNASLSPRKLHIFNTKNNSTICELNFVTPILSVKLNKKRMVVVLETKIHIYDISTMKILHTIDTKQNPKGTCAFSPSEDNCYLAFPGAADRSSIVIFDALSLQVVNVINAHKTPLSKLTINQSGTMIASASTKGTVIRVSSLPDWSKSWQFRRGSYPAAVHSICFSLDSTFLCGSSDTGTVHIFKLDQSNASNGAAKGSMNNNTGMGSYLPMLGDMWDTIPVRGFASIKLPNGIENICAMNQSNTVVMIATADGKFYQYTMDPKVGGELKLTSEAQILKLKSADDITISTT